ncbi:MAG: hypothetical protein J0H94_11625 [Rhizobiales bacterium]|nr:hypothetical protein [Hyphomicrobiales bacterium]
MHYRSMSSGKPSVRRQGRVGNVEVDYVRGEDLFPARWPSEEDRKAAFLFPRQLPANQSLHHEDGPPTSVAAANATGVDPDRGPGDVGLAARDLNVFDEAGWFVHCMAVLTQCGWMQDSKLASNVRDAVFARAPDDAGLAAADADPSLAEMKLLELAARHLADPFGQVWYVASMLSLFFVHQDDMRVGFLWAEYQGRLLHERDAVRGKTVRAGGRDGARQKAENNRSRRHEILRMMQELTEKGIKVSQAAALVHRRGYGKSPDANRKSWNRSQKK